MTTEKIVSYTAEQAELAVERYLQGVTVEAIAAELGKSVRSVIAVSSGTSPYSTSTRAALPISRSAKETAWPVPRCSRSTRWTAYG